MSRDAQQDHSQPFEHLIATIFTCRSVVKYNLTLSSEQKQELIGDIDSSLEVLRSYLTISPARGPGDTSVRPELAQADTSSASETDALPSDLPQPNEASLRAEELHTNTHPSAGQDREGEQKNFDLTLLFQAYDTHQQLGRLKGDLAGRVREMTTFLNFLKQNVTNTMNGREELIVRLNYATSLFEDMARLLAEYEKATLTLL